MKTHLQCASCVIDDLRGALLTSVADEKLRLDILREALSWLGDTFDCDRIPSYYITRVHRLLKERAGLEMPFRELRDRCNQAGMAIREVVAERVRGTPDDLERLRLLTQWAIAGNHLDFRTVGTGYDLATSDITAQLETVIGEGLAVDHTLAFLQLARQAPRVLYLADNVGEIALDTLLVVELQRHGCSVTVAVKGGPITSDAVREDAHVVGMDKLAPVILTGPDTLGLSLDETSPDVARELHQAQLIISKGQANYYACSEVQHQVSARIMCLLRTKCQIAADSLNVHPARVNLAVLLGA
jgi:damage-control phosphatase, subfamily I